MIDVLLRDVDTARVLAASAALQLDLQNVNELLLLQALSARAAALVTPPGRPLSSSAVRRLLASDEVGGPNMSAQLDEFDGFPVVELPLPPRRLLVLEGVATGSAQVADGLLRSVLADPTGKFPILFTAQVLSAAKFLLGLSDLLAHRFDRTVDDRAPALTRRINVPSAAQLDLRSRLVTFEASELFAGLSEAESRFLYTNLVWKHGEVTPSAPVDADSAAFTGHFGVDLDSSLVVRPLIDTHLGVIVASPTELATALRHFIIVSAYRHDCTQQLVDSLTKVAVADAALLLNAMTDEPLVDASPEGVSGFVRMTAPFDGDKVMDLRVSVDTLENYEPTSVWGAATNAVADVAPLGTDPDRTLVLEVRSGVGRDDQLFVGADEGPSLALPADDLQTILRAPETNSLTLWYFARALRRLGESTQVMSFSTVDTFSLFRDSRDSLYLSDDVAPTLLSVTPGHGKELREEAHRAAGPAFALYANGISRSISMHAEASPVRTVFADPNVCFVRLGDVTAWARVRTFGAADAGDRQARVLAESMAYWLWQLHLVAPGLLELARPQSELIVELRLDSIHDDTDDVVNLDLAEGTWVSYDEASVCPAPPVLGAASAGFYLDGWPPSVAAPGAPPNGFDRQLVSALVDGLVALVSTAESWPSERRRHVVDVVAPPGWKIMTQVINAEDDLLLWPGRLPSAPYVSDAATAIVLDELGAHLAESGFRHGKVADVDRTAFLNDHVTAFLQDWLARELAELAGHGALRQLLGLHEALLHEMASDERHLPIRIACFGEAANDVRRIRRHRQKATTSAIALRYLVERLSARPSDGVHDLTRERYDLVLAIAAEIVNKGMLSDALHGGLADNEISVLRSGRLGVSREQEAFTRAIAEFAEGLTTRTVAEAAALASDVHRDGRELSDDVDSAAAPGEQTTTGSPLEALNPLAVAEYGFSYTQLVNGCGGLIDASRQRGQDDVGELELSVAITAIRAATDVDDDLAHQMIACLSLDPVDDFSSAGADAFPWRFTRGRSFIVRPLVVVSEEAEPDRVLFGHRALWLTPRRWLERHLSGRLQANSPAMRRALAAQRDAKGGQFEIEVAEVLKAMGAGPVRRRFVRAGSMDLANVDGENLGDIDVLAATPTGVLVAVEAKDLEAARTPVEVVREVRALSTGPKAATARLARRVEQLSANVRAVEDTLGLEHVARRRVVALVVTNAPLLGSRLSDSHVRIVALTELPAMLADLDDIAPRGARRR
ncbi:hypothetical protein H9623_04935 [Oerskovia sp. Sa1BUA8]|uniref:Uncharacterized protein n=1 Tax=Oerskovia douganii TaxID=2762210 RepID=A0A9D5YXY8_9CELL|nr:hypothetical protein [Oerskovia douganii]MBE7699655.1 hypothetical protein [Oerskovia douganii]